MFNATEFISEVGIVPVVKLTDAATTLPVMEALIAGNVPVAEITFRTDCAAEAIRIAAEELGDKMLVGAGTVVDAAQAEAAIKSGARFIVSPGYSEAVNGVCRANGILYVPGAVTPTEIMQACAGGNKIIKFFPASVYGGTAALKALGAPFKDIKFVPTGGVNASNLKEYLSLNNVAACGGSWMVADSILKAGNYAEVARLAAEASEIVHSLGKQVG